jgi:hypothetical protein
LCFYFNFFLLFSAITNIIFSYPQPVRSVPPVVRLRHFENHCSRCTVHIAVVV